MAEWNFKEMLEQCGNEYLIENDADSSLIPMDYFDEYYQDESPLDIVLAVRKGYSWWENKNGYEDFNPNDEYLSFNGYANPISISESMYVPYLESQINEDDFKDWCIEQGYFEE